jgi:SAM-dependent methyltransferase
MRPEQDAYGQLNQDYYAGKAVIEIIEREDGHIAASMLNPRMYFAEYEEWPAFQQEALQYAQGRVLDVGCGAGRVALHLQGVGLEVVGIDNSPLAIQVCRARGVRDARLFSITRVSSALGRFDTIVMLGNNFRLFGNFRRARWLLRRFAGMTSPQARLIAESRDIYQTDNPQQLPSLKKKTGSHDLAAPDPAASDNQSEGVRALQHLCPAGANGLAHEN